MAHLLILSRSLRDLKDLQASSSGATAESRPVAGVEGFSWTYAVIVVGTSESMSGRTVPTGVTGGTTSLTV